MSPPFPPAFGFYGILSHPARGYDYLTQLLVDHKVRFIQLRMKNAPEPEVLAVAERLRKITAGTQSLFVVNDFPAIAKAVAADGVHVGQDDLSVEEVRKIVGPDMIVGLSTHNPDQTRGAAGRADYIGVGPVYKTPTKEKADLAVGIAGMQAMLTLAKVPAVVLGAVDETNLPDVLRAGARNFASVRPINQSDEPEKSLRRLLKIYREET